MTKQVGSKLGSWRSRLLFAAAGLSLLTGLSACGNQPLTRADEGGSSRELATSSDQTEAQRRAGIRLQLAVGYYEQHQLEVALDEIKQAVAADPDLADAYSVRGLIYMEMGENRLADDNFQRALRLSPSNPDFANNYGWFLCQTGRPKESIAHFETALKSRNYQSPAKALTNAGVCSLKFNDTVAAQRYLSQAFQFDAGNPLTNAKLAQLAYERNDYERARFYIGLVLKTDVQNAEALWTAIKVERKLGDTAAEASLVTQLRRRFGSSSEFAAYQRGAFDE
ncbi:type IV pilus assembly protein PilF [Collimonas sp. OK607]|uniref:type IV pilus biogenesis/stability protein PilW n=1 Tax=Collimonas sp. OK607 TaxID=1798194 RepID=UPI0008EB1DF8|nr:type IV pilus biogenesis/stability protein PilW [Collimonas sp. OK607]SFA70797.1 type IV pilus assembly protein PilF [Collimonas sp. OK607]